MNWNTVWTASKDPARQRKYVKNAPLHVQGSFMNSHLSDELSAKLKKRSLRVRTGDKVKVMRGSHKGKTGTVERVEMKRQKVFITGVDFGKKDGSRALYPIHPSKLLITATEMEKRHKAKKPTTGAKK